MQTKAHQFATLLNCFIITHIKTWKGLKTILCFFLYFASSFSWLYLIWFNSFYSVFSTKHNLLINYNHGLVYFKFYLMILLLLDWLVGRNIEKVSNKFKCFNWHTSFLFKGQTLLSSNCDFVFNNYILANLTIQLKGVKVELYPVQAIQKRSDWFEIRLKIIWHLRNTFGLLWLNSSKFTEWQFS